MLFYDGNRCKSVNPDIEWEGMLKAVDLWYLYCLETVFLAVYWTQKIEGYHGHDQDPLYYPNRVGVRSKVGDLW